MYASFGKLLIRLFIYYVFLWLFNTKFRSECDFDSPYPNIDGTCNNNMHPKWGSAMTAFKR